MFVRLFAWTLNSEESIFFYWDYKSKKKLYSWKFMVNPKYNQEKYDKKTDIHCHNIIRFAL